MTRSAVARSVIVLLCAQGFTLAGCNTFDGAEPVPPIRVQENPHPTDNPTHTNVLPGGLPTAGRGPVAGTLARAGTGSAGSAGHAGRGVPRDADAGADDAGAQ